MQQIIVYIVFIVCVLVVVRYIGNSFINRSDKKNPCANCTSDCKLKSSLKKNKELCDSQNNDDRYQKGV